MKNLRIKEIVIVLSLASFLIACGSDGNKNNVSINIAPATATTDVGTARPFTVTVTGSSNTGYTVSATPARSGCPTGAQTGGTVNCTPTTAGTYTITVTASADTSKTKSATLTATTPAPVVGITITPESENVELEAAQTFKVGITGSDNKNYTVDAPVAAGCGAPSGDTFTCTPTAAGAYKVTVTASADTAKTTFATLTAVAPFSSAPPTTGTASGACSNPIGTGTDRARIAVASNFYVPAQTLVKEWFQESADTNTSIIVCHNSTGTLRTEINNGYDGYSMFFAADESAQNYDSPENTSFVYASGVPVLAAKKDVIPDAGGLITGLTGNAATIEDAKDELAGTYEVNIASAQKVSVADPGQAPYGVAAQLILNNMMGENIPATLPSWVFGGGNVAANGLWNNIDNTFAAVNADAVGAIDTSDVKSGIIGKSQICDNIAPKAADPTWVYVEFIHPDFIRNQKAVLLDSENPAASKLNGYIKGAMTSGAWTGFLADNCYNPVP